MIALESGSGCFALLHGKVALSIAGSMYVMVLKQDLISPLIKERG